MNIPKSCSNDDEGGPLGAARELRLQTTISCCVRNTLLTPHGLEKKGDIACVRHCSGTHTRIPSR